ncbi:hypothetical protein P261_02342 [Lachnospiraceae bacterium TWA4]|nr:hypothetical protein P261_02342 [Lachnospiraceae bacterium TWA4]
MSEFYRTLNDLDQQSHIQLLKNFSQHRSSTTYHHCKRVATMSYKLARFFHLSVHESQLARGAMLHDYYLYDAMKEDISPYRHGTSHANQALVNAQKVYNLTPLEQDIIYSHMWPLNITHVPKSKEAALVSISDKIVAIQEFLNIS